MTRHDQILALATRHLAELVDDQRALSDTPDALDHARTLRERYGHVGWAVYDAADAALPASFTVADDTTGTTLIGALYHAHWTDHENRSGFDRPENRDALSALRFHTTNLVRDANPWQITDDIDNGTPPDIANYLDAYLAALTKARTTGRTEHDIADAVHAGIAQGIEDVDLLQHNPCRAETLAQLLDHDHRLAEQITRTAPTPDTALRGDEPWVWASGPDSDYFFYTPATAQAPPSTAAQHTPAADLSDPYNGFDFYRDVIGDDLVVDGVVHSAHEYEPDGEGGVQPRGTRDAEAARYDDPEYAATRALEELIDDGITARVEDGPRVVVLGMFDHDWQAIECPRDSHHANDIDYYADLLGTEPITRAEDLLAALETGPVRTKIDGTHEPTPPMHIPDHVRSDLLAFQARIDNAREDLCALQSTVAGFGRRTSVTEHVQPPPAHHRPPQPPPTRPDTDLRS